jgi:phosphatidylserine/phosphatidylglycerophosphate/cardiolipin synthase-like enzyme
MLMSELWTSLKTVATLGWPIVTRRLQFSLDPLNHNRCRERVNFPAAPESPPSTTAVQYRGVEVHLVASEKGDHPVVALAQESYYEELLEAGVQIHLYRKNFLHAKHLSIDDLAAVIGTSNLDIRSFALNAELMLMIYDPEVTARLAAEQERYFANSRLLTLAMWQQRSFGRKFAQNLARLLSPLL